MHFTLRTHLSSDQLHFKCSVAILDSGRRDLGLNEHFGAHEKHWAEKQLSSKQNVWEEQRDTNTPESSNFLPGATDCDTKSFGCLRQVFFGTKLFNFPPEPLILIHQSPNLQRSRMAVHKSFYEKMEHFHHPQRTSIGSLPLLTHPSNMARMTGITLGAFRKCYENGKCYGNLSVSDGSTEGARWSLSS